MKLYTSIQIDETDTEVIIDYCIIFGEPEIEKITDVHTGNAIAPDLLEETNRINLLNELHEAYCDEQSEKYSHSPKGWNDRCGKNIYF